MITPSAFPNAARDAAAGLAFVGCDLMNGAPARAQVPPPAWAPIFMKPETDPEKRPPMSALTAQNELCEK